jgi:hypothetical protein
LIHSEEATRNVNGNCAQGKRHVSEPVKWEVRKRCRGVPSLGRSPLPPKPPPKKSRVSSLKKGWTMSNDTWTVGSTQIPYDEYCPDEGSFEDGMLGGPIMEDRTVYANRDMEEDDEDPEQLDLEIAEKELQLLTKKRAFQRRLGVQQSGPSNVKEFTDMGMLRSSERDRRARRCQALK